MFRKICVSKKIILFLILSSVCFQSNKLMQDVEILSSTGNTCDAGKMLIVSVQKNSGNEILISTQWKAGKLIQIITKAEKQDFLKEFVKIFPKNSTVQEMVFTYVFKNSFMKAETLKYKYIDTMNLRNLWQRVEFAKILDRIQNTTAPEIFVQAKGWTDEFITTDCDDPANDSRALYKIKVNLISGLNEIYISPKKNKLSSKLIEINYNNEIKQVPERVKKFHNSEVEAGCTPCHDGLPSASDGEEMKADCLSCHKEKLIGNKVHSLIEMNECLSCHSWSKENNAVIVESGATGSCTNCHSEVLALLENSKYPHPIAHECLACHSPHNSNEKMLLRDNVYNICRSCHDKYDYNHPVSNHPVRLRILNEAKGEEISCVSCHHPHASNNKAIMKVSGGRMAICLNCHNK